MMVKIRNKSCCATIPFIRKNNKHFKQFILFNSLYILYLFKTIKRTKTYIILLNIPPPMGGGGQYIPDNVVNFSIALYLRDKATKMLPTRSAVSGIFEARDRRSSKI